jgi:hypothetical protein
MVERETRSTYAPPKQYIPSAILKRGRALLHRQCWLWGQDITREGGNLLLAYGFERVRPPEGISGSSQYTLELPGERHLRLWGFGFYFGSATGIYVNRYEFIPRETSLRDLWQAKEMDRLRRAHEFNLLPEAVRPIASYESWVMREYGAEYRASCLRGWDSKVGGGLNIAADWLELAKSLEAHLATSPSLSLPAVERPARGFTKAPSITDSRHSYHRGKTRAPSRGNPVAASA